jgi:hypothetical protein
MSGAIDGVGILVDAAAHVVGTIGAAAFDA